MSIPARDTREASIPLKAFLILSSLSPLPALMLIRGNTLLPGSFEIICAVLFVLPNCFLGLRLRSAKQKEGKHTRLLGKSDNDSYQIFIYILALLLPFYRYAADEPRELFATIAALILIFILFWRFNLYYINIYFLIRGYRVYTIHPAENAGLYSENANWTLITRRPSLPIDSKINVYRITNTVYLEAN